MTGSGARARECAEARRGATARAVAAMRELYRVPRYRPAMPWYLRGVGAGAGVAPGGQAAAVPVLCAAAQAGRAGDQRRQSHDGRNGEDAVRAAPGGVVARTRAEAGDSDARLRADVAGDGAGAAAGSDGAHRGIGRRAADLPACAGGAGGNRGGPVSHGHAAVRGSSARTCCCWTMGSSM